MGNDGTSIKINDKKYEIIKILGQSEFEREILVKNKSDNNQFAIKEIIIGYEMKNKIKDIQKEVDILCKFNCKNIIKHYNSSLYKGKFYIITEYFNGQNLKILQINFLKLTN